MTASGIDSDAQNLRIDTGLSRDLKTRNIIETPSPVSSTGTPISSHTPIIAWITYMLYIPN